MNILKEYEGLIGALSGVIVTLILTHVLKNVGGLKIYAVNNDIEFIKNGKTNEGFHTKEIADKMSVNFLSVEFHLEIYNNSETARIFREIELCFYKGSEKVFSTRPEDKETEKRYQSGQSLRSEILNINVMPKQITSRELVRYLRKDDVDIIRECNKLLIELKDYKGRTNKILLKEF